MTFHQSLSSSKLQEHLVSHSLIPSKITKLSSAEIERRFRGMMGWVAQGPHAQYNISVIREIERALGQDIGELSVQRLNSGLETIGPSELHAFHAVVLVYST